MASAALLESIVQGNIHHAVPPSLFDAHLGQKETVTPKAAVFDPQKHLQCYASLAAKEACSSTRRLTMAELGLTSPRQISPIGVSDPFPLFTDEAIAIMRLEILDKDTFLRYARFCHNSSSGMDCIMRGYVKNGHEISAPFVYQAWTHPKTTELISEIAGVDLEIIMDYEIAHVNIGIKDPQQADKERSEWAKTAGILTRKGSGDDIPAIVGWHYDSYPFVCVLMLSDTTNMIGGETGLRKGLSKGEDSQIAVVPGPQKGSASVLQGRLIEHIAPSPVGHTERITMVTSYRAKNALIEDGSVLTTVKPEINYGTRFADFYPQWIAYRAEVVKARLDHLVETMKGQNGVFDKAASMAALKAIDAYLTTTYTEMEVSEEEWKRARKKSFS